MMYHRLKDGFSMKKAKPGCKNTNRTVTALQIYNGCHYQYTQTIKQFEGRLCTKPNNAFRLCF